MLISSEFPKRAAAVVIAKDGTPTCISKTSLNILDYFLVDSGMAATVTGVEVDVDSGIAPHRPSMIIFAAKSYKRKTLYPGKETVYASCEAFWAYEATTHLEADD